MISTLKWSGEDAKLDCVTCGGRTQIERAARLGNPNPLRALPSSVPEVSSTLLYLSLPTHNLAP
jgi:hypothetical protein